MKLAIIGCARSDIKHTVELLQFANIRVGFEKLLDDGIGSWFASADDVEIEHRSENGDFKPMALEHFSYVVHQTRHPLAVISSLQRTPMQREQQKFVQKHVRTLGSPDSLLWAMTYWLNWTDLCASKTDLQFRVEVVQWTLPALYLYTKRSTKGCLQAVQHVVQKTTETIIMWKDLDNENRAIADKIRRRAQFYGYDL